MARAPRTADGLPPGPEAPPLVQTVALHRDPVGVLVRARARFGPVFTLRLVFAGPMVAVSERSCVEPLLASDPEAAHAGEGRRRLLPMASERSVFGGDAERHRAARGAIEGAFAPEVVSERADAMGRVAAAHALSWPRGRPFRLLPRMRALLDDVFVRLILGVADERRRDALARAIGRLIQSPGNPPLPLPGEAEGLPGAAAAALFERRARTVTKLLVEEMRTRAPGEARTDVVGLSLAASPDEPPEAHADRLMAVLMAGQEPPAAALTWLLERAGREPGLQELLAEGAGDPRRETVVMESLRLRPPALASIRRLTRPLSAAGHELPMGTVTMVPIPLVQLDPDGPFIPFGGGARRCIGEHLARAYLDAVVTAVLRQVRLRPVWPRPERAVLRGTILVPHRSAL